MVKDVSKYKLQLAEIPRINQCFGPSLFFAL